MKIGIIGAGHIGGTLTRRLRKLGYDVSVANSRGPETLKDLADETGATPVSVQDAVVGKDLIIVSIPEKAITSLPRGLFANVPETTIVIDTGNYYPQRDGKIAEIESGIPESQWVSEQLGHAVIKVFNNIYSKHLMDSGRPTGTPDRVALPVAGDDPAAKRKVIELLDKLGFDGVDAGTLDESWRQQPGTPVYTMDFTRDGVRRALHEASKERPAEFRAK